MNARIAANTMTSVAAREAAAESLNMLIGHFVAFFRDNLRIRGVRNDLRRLDDHMLEDIGLTRYDVEFGDLGFSRLSALSAKGHPENI